jgi:hypothetical protein
MRVDRLPRSVKGIALAAVVAGLLVPTFAAPAAADPPEWAPAHGWHKKHKHHHEYYVDDDDDVIVVQRRSPRVVYVEPPPRVVYVEPPPPRVVYREPAYVEPAPVYRGPRVVQSSACGVISRDTIGTVLGGAGAGVLGSHVGRGSGRTAATIGATLGGALVGGSIGRSLDHAEGC